MNDEDATKVALATMDVDNWCTRCVGGVIEGLTGLFPEIDWGAIFTAASPRHDWTVIDHGEGDYEAVATREVEA